MSNSVLRVETLTGQSIKVKNTQVRVRSQVLQLRLPMANGGLIWNRPVAVLVRTSDGHEQMLPVPDLTRIAVLILAGLCFTSMFLLLLYGRQKVES
jgi:hypothetical protein